MKPHYLLALFAFVIGAASSIAQAQVAPSQSVGYQQVAAVFQKYCVGCHNDKDREGKFSVASLSSLRAGTPDGPVIVASNPEQSKLLKVLSGKLEPAMPPEDEPQPSPEELLLLRTWIEQGAMGEEASMPKSILHFVAPNLPSAATEFHHVGAACAVTQDNYALGRLSVVELFETESRRSLWKVEGLAGKVNSLRPSSDKKPIAVGCGIAGLGGEALLLNSEDGSVVQRILGHSDSIYCAALSPNGQVLATGSYDRKIILWI